MDALQLQLLLPAVAVRPPRLPHWLPCLHEAERGGALLGKNPNTFRATDK